MKPETKCVSSKYHKKKSTKKIKLIKIWNDKKKVQKHKNMLYYKK